MTQPNQTIYFSDYKFDITLEPAIINVKIFNTKTLDLYEGSVNSNDIYINPLDKFYKMLSSALELKPGFTFAIENQPDKLKCKLNYATEFFDLEELFVVNKKDNNKAVEYHLNNKIEALEGKNVLLTNQIDLLKTELNQIKLTVQTLEKYAFLPITYQSTGSPCTSVTAYIPINNVSMIMTSSGVGIRSNPTNKVASTFGEVVLDPISTRQFPGRGGISYSLDSTKILQMAPFNATKIIIDNVNIHERSNYYIWTLDTIKIGAEFLTQYLSSKSNVIFDEINIQNTSDDIIYVLTKFKNYKMVQIKKLERKIPSDYKYIETHCKDNNIQFILT